MFCKTLTDSNHPSRQAELACMVLHFLSEDLTQFDVTQGQEGSHFDLGSIPHSMLGCIQMLLSSL